MIESKLNYLAAMDERPAYYLYPPPAGTPMRNTKGDRRTIRIHDARALEAPTLDREGFDPCVGLVRTSNPDGIEC